MHEDPDLLFNKEEQCFFIVESITVGESITFFCVTRLVSVDNFSPSQSVWNRPLMDYLHPRTNRW
jgi:hypothetical protein